jgi:hypothetical protein
MKYIAGQAAPVPIDASDAVVSASAAASLVEAKAADSKLAGVASRVAAKAAKARAYAVSGSTPQPTIRELSAVVSWLYYGINAEDNS